MLTINLDTLAGTAKPVSSAPIRVGVSVPVKIQCVNGSPGGNPAFQLAITTDSAPPQIKAFLDVFGAENDSAFLGLLDANDARLLDYMATKATASLNVELRWTVDGPAPDERVAESAPNFKITVEPTAIQPGEASEGGPVYQTQTEADARYARLTNLVALLAGLDLSTLPAADPGDGKPWLNGGVLQVGA